MNFGRIWNWFCKVCLILLILISINSILGDILFRIKYSFPKVSETTQNVINTQKNPIQNNLTNSSYIKAYGEKNIFILKPQAEYSIAGMVVTKNTNFWVRDIMRTSFDDICLMDIGIVWGELAADKQKLYKNWKFKSLKTLGESRRLEWRSKVPADTMPWSLNFVSSHISHTHLIPANANVMGALLTIKINDIVKFDGYLVDIYTAKNQLVANTSLSRTDTDPTSRGSGACEDMYVKQVQINNKIYR